MMEPKQPPLALSKAIAEGRVLEIAELNGEYDEEYVSIEVSLKGVEIGINDGEMKYAERTLTPNEARDLSEHLLQAANYAQSGRLLRRHMDSANDERTKPESD